MEENAIEGMIMCSKTTCQYLHRYCNQARLDDYNFCIRHILEDKAAPFKQCDFIHPQSRKRCPNAAPKPEELDETVLCPYHLKESQRRKSIMNAKTKPLDKNVSAFLKSLEQYCTDPSHSRSYTREMGLAEMQQNTPCDGPPTTLREFEPEDAGEISDLAYVENFIENQRFDMGYDVLKNPTVLPVLEVAMIEKEKTLRLQQLYYQQLYMLLAQKKKVRRQREQICNQKTIQGDPVPPGDSKPFTAEEDKDLRDLLHYQFRHYPLKKFYRHRFKELYSSEEKTVSRCTFFTNGIHCEQSALPLFELCSQHILKDEKQILFRPCASRDCTKPIEFLSDILYCEDHSCSHIVQSALENYAQTIRRRVSKLVAAPVQKSKRLQEKSQSQVLTTKETGYESESKRRKSTVSESTSRNEDSGDSDTASKFMDLMPGPSEPASVNRDSEVRLSESGTSNMDYEDDDEWTNTGSEHSQGDEDPYDDGLVDWL